MDKPTFDPQPNDAATVSKPPSGLYLVATPIGNKRDITLRALDLLAQADLIACEDTRVTARLLMLLGIPAPRLISYHDHNAAKAGDYLLEHLQAGAVVALVSDAGMPLISDPGFALVRDCVERGIAVTGLPGPSAALLALQLSGLPCERFFFAGFLPSKSTARHKDLSALADIPSSLIFFESPNRLVDSLADMLQILGNRPAAVTRELTKMFEEVKRAPLADLAAFYAQTGALKGEIVVVVGPPLPPDPMAADDIDRLLRQGLQNASAKTVSTDLAARLGLKKRDLYQRALQLSGKKDEE